MSVNIEPIYYDHVIIEPIPVEIQLDISVSAAKKIRQESAIDIYVCDPISPIVYTPHDPPTTEELTDYM